MLSSWVQANSTTATQVQDALKNIINFSPYTASISLDGMPPSLRSANFDGVHYDSRQQIFLANKFFEAIPIAMNNIYGGGYGTQYNSGEVLLVRQVAGYLFLNNYYSAYRVFNSTPSTSQLYNTPFGCTELGQGFCGLNLTTTKSMMNSGAVLTLDTSGGYWAPVCQNMNYVYNGQPAMPIFDKRLDRKKDKNPYGPEFKALALEKALEKTLHKAKQKDAKQKDANRDSNCIITADLKKYGYKQGNKVDFAASNNRLDWIKQLIELGYKVTTNAIAYAATNGHLEVIKYLHELGYKGYKGTKDAINYAATNGHLEVIKYLHELGYKGYKGTKDAIDNAATNGHLEVIKYLHELGYKGDDYAINYAARKNHIEVFKYLRSVGYDETTIFK
nr:uncharacterized protein LOC124817118 [Hydra vulgaris]